MKAPTVPKIDMSESCPKTMLPTKSWHLMTAILGISWMVLEYHYSDDSRLMIYHYDQDMYPTILSDHLSIRERERERFLRSFLAKLQAKMMYLEIVNIP